MDTLLANGDHAIDGRGLPMRIEGLKECLQQALIRLSVRRGSFARDPLLGSELYRLPAARAEGRDRMALGYAQEALAPIRALTVLDARCRHEDAGILSVELELAWAEQSYLLTVDVA